MKKLFILLLTLITLSSINAAEQAQPARLTIAQRKSRALDNIGLAFEKYRRIQNKVVYVSINRKEDYFLNCNNNRRNN